MLRGFRVYRASRVKGLRYLGFRGFRVFKGWGLYYSVYMGDIGHETWGSGVVWIED